MSGVEYQLARVVACDARANARAMSGSPCLAAAHVEDRVCFAGLLPRGVPLLLPLPLRGLVIGMDTRLVPARDERATP